jgi:broad specificity phosphatase PhoE
MGRVRNLASLIMVRHGESTGNLVRAAAYSAGLAEYEIPERDADVPLTDTGREQSAALGKWLAALPEHRRPTAVVTSPYLRAAETARLAWSDVPAVPLRTDERLRDRELGILEGLTGRGIQARHPEEAARKHRLGKFYYRPPGGESWADMALRLRSVLADIDRDHPGGRVLVVAHDAVIVITRYIIESLSEQEMLEVERTLVANCGISTWERGPGGFRLTAYNRTDHLDRYTAEFTANDEVGL